MLRILGYVTGGFGVALLVFALSVDVWLYTVAKPNKMISTGYSR